VPNLKLLRLLTVSLPTAPPNSVRNTRRVRRMSLATRLPITFATCDRYFWQRSESQRHQLAIRSIRPH
jgi:hypothetical protein